MEYRDQLDYIKSRGQDGKKGSSPAKKSANKPKKKKPVQKNIGYGDDFDLEFDDFDDDLKEFDLDAELAKRDKRQRRKPAARSMSHSEPPRSRVDKEHGNLRQEKVRKRATGKETARKAGREACRPRPRKSAAGSLLASIQIFTAAFFAIATIILYILPIPYIVVLFLLAFLSILFVQKRKSRPSGKAMAILTSFLFLIVGFYSLRAEVAIYQVSAEADGVEDAEAQAIDVQKTPFNIYISGIDVYGDLSQESRSDVNLIATVNQENESILLTTTPRDYYVVIPGISGEQKDKLTHAGIYGIDASVDTLENLYGTEIPFYVRVNFTSVIDIVDTLGGIDVDSEVAFTTSKAAGCVVDIAEGENHLNGEQALAFVRERKAFVSGDNQRGKNQQVLLKALIKKMVSPTIIVKANSIIGKIAGNMETNMSEKQIKALIRLQLLKFIDWDIESVAATGNDSGKLYCYSYSGGPLYVTVPDSAVVAEISEKIAAYLE